MHKRVTYVDTLSYVCMFCVMNQLVDVRICFEWLKALTSPVMIIIIVDNVKYSYK